MNTDLLEAKINMLANELEAKIRLISPNDTTENRIKSLEFASSMYRNDDGNMGDKTATGFLAFADEVYKYIKEGTSNA
jgi:hypothetical protein